MKTFNFKTPATVARVFGCTEAQARKQYEKNRAEVLGMLLKARDTGRRVNNYTEQELEQMVIAYNRVLGPQPVTT